MPRKDMSLEGLRGVAALTVVFAHFFFAFVPYLAIYSRPGLEIPLKFGWEPIFVVPIISLLYNGSFAVSVFFVLSGYVLTKRFFDNGNSESLRQSAIKRYPRLMIPVFAATMFAFCIYRLGLMHNEIAGNIQSAGWPLIYYTNPISLETSVFEALYGTPFAGIGQLIGPIWTIKIELVGSLLLLATYAVAGKRYPPLGLFIFSIFAVCVAPQSEYVLHYFAIFAGSLIHYGEQKLRRRPAISASLIVIGLLCGSFDYSPLLAWWQHIALPAFPAPLVSLEAAKRTFYESVGAVLLVSGVIGFAPASRMLSSRLPAYLGRISFSLYLLHWPIIFSLSYWLMDYGILRQGWSYGLTLILAAVVSFGVIVLCSDLFERWVDGPAIAAANKIARRISGPRADPVGKISENASIL